MRRERWRPVLGYPGYEASDRGHVRNARTLRSLLWQPSDSGYWRVKVTVRGRQRDLRVHVAVLLAFVGRRPSPRHQGAHADGDKRNNRLSNLAWKTPRANAKDKRLHGTHPREFTGYDDPELALAAKILVLLGLSYSKAARELGMHRHSVSRIVRGLRRAAA